LSSAGISFGSWRRLARLEQLAQRGGRSAVGTATKARGYLWGACVCGAG
jgi:hypothetical protein